MKYPIARRFIRFLLSIFFRRVTCAGAPLVMQGPVLVVANHPNQVFDPLLLVYLWPRQLYFLAKSTLFRGISGVVVRRLNMIPVYRKQDSSDLSQNEATFSSVSGKLRSGGAVAIFPEGTSIGELKLMPLKTGAARIAAQTLAEAASSFTLSVQAVGIAYADMYTFRSSVTLTVMPPLELTPLALPAAPEERANFVRRLTGQIESYLRTSSVDLPDSETRLLSSRLSWLYEGLSKVNDLERYNRIQLNLTQHSDPELRSQIIGRIDALRSRFSKLGLYGDECLAGYPTLADAVVAVSAFPGMLLFRLPYRLVQWIVQRRASEPVYIATMKLAWGILVHSGWVCLMALLAFMLTSSAIWAVMVAVVLGILGTLAVAHAQAGRATLARVIPKRRYELQQAVQERERLRLELEALRVDLAE